MWARGDRRRRKGREVSEVGTPQREDSGVVLGTFKNSHMLEKRGIIRDLL